MTTSANIAGTVRPFMRVGSGMVMWPYGKGGMYKVDEIRPCKDKKKCSKAPYGQIGVIHVGMIGEAFTEPVGNPKDGFWKIKKTGKIGVWRTIKGRRYFFPVDGSSPTPKVRGKKKAAASSGGGGGAPKKKKGILGQIMDKISSALGGGKGTKVGLKDVKPKKAKEKGPTSIEGGDEMLKDVESIMLKASRSKDGKKVGGALKKMQAALKSDDPDAFKKAEQALAMATAKLAKKKGQ